MSKLRSLLTAVIYVRVSSEKQIDNFSLDTQTKILREYAEANGYKVIKVFREEGRSGTNINRSAYQEMRQYLCENHVDVVLTHKLDRLHRDEFNVFNDVRFFKEHHIRFIAVADGIDTFNDDSNLLIAVQSALGANFSRNLSKETRKGLLAGAENCLHMGGTPPYGFKVNHDNGMLEIDETTAPAVRQIFTLYAEGFSTKEICHWLTEHGYKTAKGNEFKANAINAILHNEKYRGYYVWDKAAPKDSEGHRNSHAVKDTYIRIEDGCPRIISDELFTAAQERLALNSDKASRAKPKRYYPLNGRIYCAECGSRMTGNVQYSSGKRYFQYRCSNSCGNKYLKAEALEDSILTALEECLFSEPNRQMILDTLNLSAAEHKHDCDSTYQQLTSKRSGLETAQNNLLKAVESGKATTAIMNRLERISGELEQTEFKITSLDRTVHYFTEDDLAELQEKFKDYMKNRGTVNAKRLLNSTIGRVDVTRSQVQITLADGIAVDRETKTNFIQNKGVITMNNTKKIEGILLSANGKDNDMMTLEFRLRYSDSCCFNGTCSLDMSQKAFVKLAADSEMELFEMFGKQFNITFNMQDGKVIGVAGIEAA